MGAFFTNVQVQVGGRDGAVARQALLRVLRELAAEQGMAEPAAGETADRTILVGEAGGAWISVYDEATEGQDEATLGQLAQRISAALETAAVTVLVHDSDVLLLSLYERGKRLASHDSNPGYFGGKRRRPALKLAPWARLLAPGRAEADLETALREEKLFAEETLQRLAGLFAMDPPAVAVGYGYAAAGELSAPVTTLRFRSAVRPAHERAAGGAPRFEPAAYSPALDGSVGFPLRAVFGVRNAGGAGRGLDIVVWGDAISRGLVHAGEAQLVVGLPGANQPVSGKLQRRDELQVASFTDVELPAGIEGGLAAAVSPEKMAETMFRSNVHVNLTFDVLAAGAGELFVGFVPRQAPDTGRYAHTCRLDVRPASRRPLRAVENASAQLLQPLEVASTLFAMVSAAADFQQVAQLAGELIERWGAVLPERGRYSLVTFPGGPSLRPWAGSAAAGGFFKSARWKKLKQELTTQAVVTAERADATAGASDGISARRTDGFAFGRSIVARPAAGDGDPELPTLSLWMDVHGRPEAEIQAARDLLVALVGQMMSAAAGVQALVGRWGWSPGPHGSTPYELACGVHGQCTNMRSWQARYLRGVTDDWMWLGPDLAGRVSDRAALERAAVVEPIAGRMPGGGGIRVRLRPGASLDELERALADLLPGPADWRAGVDRYHGRA